MTKLRLVAVALLSVSVTSAHAQIFGGDDQARRQIIELREQLTSRIETTSRAQLDLTNQNETLRAEVARLRGQVEVLSHELESLKQRQRDFYVDLDQRIQRLEGGGAPVDGIASLGGATPTTSGPATAAQPSADPAAETAAYQAALNLLKEGKHNEALAAFNQFIAQHPRSSTLPNAHFWAGNAALQARDIATARRHFNTVLDNWPQDRVAADAMLGLANTQQALGDGRGAQETLRRVVSTYPDSSAAQVAKQRLGQ